MSESLVVPVVTDVHLPAGILGPEPVTYDVRAFLVPRDDGIVLIDTGFDPDPGPIAEALHTIGAKWDDVTDIILTHAHVDHVGGLAAVAASAPSATVWAGHGDIFPSRCDGWVMGTSSAACVCSPHRGTRPDTCHCSRRHTEFSSSETLWET